MDYKKSILGSFIAILLATSCCWLPALLIAIGGGSTLIAISTNLDKFSGLFLTIGAGLLGLGFFQYQKFKKKTSKDEAIMRSVITCPECGFSAEETMSTNSCQYFYDCSNCKVVLKPKENDCCVFCSYGSVACPPIQLNQKCC